MQPVVLFDLDGTVLTFEGASPGPGRTAMGRAAIDLFGGSDRTEGVRFAGGTDRAIARALLERCGAIDVEANIQTLIDRYLHHLAIELGRRRYRPVGDVAHAVTELRAAGACIGLATGNVREGARLKLRSAGLEEHFSFDHGGYGCDAEVRADLVRAGIRRCRGLAPDAPVDGSGVVVVGDTRHDVEAARAAGAKAIGVAMTEEIRRELEAAGADAIVPACGPALVAAITSR